MRKSFLNSFFWFGIFPNLLFLISGHFIYMMRPVVNIDYLLVGILAAWLPTSLALLLFGAVLFNEVLVLGAPVYHFQIIDIFVWWRDILFINWRYSLPLALVLLALVFIISKIAIRGGMPFKKPARTAALFFAICFAVCSADILNGTSFILLPIHQSFANFNIAYSGARRSLLSLRDFLMSGDFASTPLAVNESAAGEILARARGASGSKPPLSKTQFAVIVVESMGRFDDDATGKAMLAPLTTSELAKRYDVQVGAVPFHGHTIDGEFRELCGVRLSTYGETKFPKCLPKYLSEQGFETVGLHGFTNQFYNRYRWYPKLGFDRTYFAEDMSRMSEMKVCGSGFTGMCDTEVAELMHRELLHSEKGKPKFVYWMTLNSHLPLDSESSKSSTFDCASTPETRQSDSVCLHTRMIHLVLSSIAKVASDPKLPPTEFVVVGDHMPPFLNNGIRSLYSPDVVPFVVLKPRQ